MNENELKKGTKIKVAIITVLLVLTAIAGISYAYFSIQVIGNDEASSVTISTATLSLEYTDGVTISGSNIYPGWSQTKTISVENTGTVTSDYIIKWRELTNGIINGELVMSATCVASTGSCSALPERVVHSSNTQITDAYMYGPITIAPGVTHTYTVTFTFKETSSNQNYNQGKTFSGTLNIADGTATDSSLFSYTVSNDEVTITGFDSSLVSMGISDVDKCIAYFTDHNLATCAGNYQSDYCNATSLSFSRTCNPSLKSIIENNIPASDYEEAGIYYNDNRPKDIIIPSTINNKLVTTISNNAFSKNQLTSVVIPSSVTSIGSGAFSVNQLTSIVIPSSITTLTSAFTNNQLTSIVIPNGVTVIDGTALWFNNIMSVVIPNSVTAIGNSAFYNNQLTSVVIPSSVTSIDNGAFSVNQLTSVTIEGKSSSSDFTSYPSSSPWDWASGYSDSNIIWTGSGS